MIQNSLTVLKKCYKHYWTYFVSSLIIFSTTLKNLVFNAKIDKTKGFYLISNMVVIIALPLITSFPLIYVLTKIDYLD